ncbi:MAG: NUDIX hydrolase [Eubacteriales bacterium]|nr:NUDIX hydrolase [Eubacteriales bacterium]
MEDFKKIPKLLKRELKYKGSILSAYQDKVDVCGHITHWDYIEHGGAAAIIPVLPNGNILMVKQFRLVANRYTLEIPAGKLEKNEKDFYECAKRELEEETGFKSNRIELLLDQNTAMAYCSERIKIYIAFDLEKGSIHNDIDEETHIEEWSIEDLKRDIFNGKINDAKSISAILAYNEKYLNKNF